MAADLSTYWMRCNRCLASYSQDRAFNVSSCGHIMCAQCSKSCGQPDGSCPICKNAVPIRIVPLGSSLPAEVACLFQDKKQLLKCLFHQMSFQRGHAQQQVQLLQQRADDLRQELLRLQDEEQQLSASLNQSPSSQNRSSRTPVMGIMSGRLSLPHRLPSSASKSPYFDQDLISNGPSPGIKRF